MDSFLSKIISESEALLDEAIALRRDFHKYAENGFCEYRTSAKIIEYLSKLGFDIKCGSDVIDPGYMLGVPDEDTQRECVRRAVDEGADPGIVEKLRGGMTALIATIEGNAPGNTVAFRFDIDANDVSESQDADHRPAVEGFSSIHNNVMHACAHDGHIVSALVLAKLLASHKKELCGKVKLIFQPAEEGVRGGEAMVKAGAVEDVDYFFGGHIGIAATEKGLVAASTDKFFSVRKFHVKFVGKSSHAALAPQKGRNALLAAAQATLALSSISRHGDGSSRINVGVLNAGTGSNVIPDSAIMIFEVRGETRDICVFMQSEAERMILSAANMYGVDVAISLLGRSDACEPDDAFAKDIAELLSESRIFSKVVDRLPMNASEDCTAFLERMRERGKHATYLMYGAELAATHHNAKFDFDEAVIPRISSCLAYLANKYTQKGLENQ